MSDEIKTPFTISYQINTLRDSRMMVIKDHVVGDYFVINFGAGLEFVCPYYGAYLSKEILINLRDYLNELIDRQYVTQDEFEKKFREKNKEIEVGDIVNFTLPPKSNVKRETKKGEKTMRKPKPKLGTGQRFKALTTKLEKQGKSADSAKKIAASAGIKKYGAPKMAKMAAKGRKK